jgi:hypothetical protein
MPFALNFAVNPFQGHKKPTRMDNMLRKVNFVLKLCGQVSRCSVLMWFRCCICRATTIMSKLAKYLIKEKILDSEINPHTINNRGGTEEKKNQRESGGLTQNWPPDDS